MALPRLFVVGDSISIQFGPYLEAMLAERFSYDRKSDAGAALLDLDRPQGANAGDSSVVLEYLAALDASGSFHVDYLLLNCGLHDLRTDPGTGAKQVPLAAYRANLERIAELAPRLAGRVLWLRTTPVDDTQHNERQIAFYRYSADVDAYNAVADEVTRRAGFTIVDLFGFTLSLGGREIYADHVHFVEPVRQQQAAFLAGYACAIADAAAACHS